MAECDASSEAPTLAQEAVLVKSEEMPKGSMTVRGYDFDESRGQVDYHALLQSYRLSGFQAMNFGLAVEQISLMVCTLYGASLVPRPCLEWKSGHETSKILILWQFDMYSCSFPPFPSPSLPSPSFSLLPHLSLLSHLSPLFDLCPSPFPFSLSRFLYCIHFHTKAIQTMQ